MSLNKTDAEFEKAANAALNEDKVDPDPASISKVAAQTSTTIKNIWPLQTVPRRRDTRQRPRPLPGKNPD